MNNSTGYHQKNVLFFILTIALFSFSQQINAQTDLYWTGATNNSFSVAGNWSTTPLNSDGSGNTTATSGPSIGTNVHFVDGSFPLVQDYIVSFDVAITVRDFLIEGLGSNATNIRFTGNPQLTVSQSLSIVPSAGILDFDKTGDILFNAATTGQTVNFADNNLTCRLVFNNGNGGWTFSSGFITTQDFLHENGSIDFNSLDFEARRFVFTGQGATSNVALGTGSKFNILYNSPANNTTLNGFDTSGTYASFTGTDIEFEKTINNVGSGFFSLELMHTAPETLTVNSVTSIGEMRLRVRENLVTSFNTIETTDGSIGFYRDRSGGIVYNIGTLRLPFSSQLLRTLGGGIQLNIDTLDIFGPRTPEDCGVFVRFSIVGLTMNFTTQPTDPVLLSFLNIINSPALVAGVTPVPAISVTESVGTGNTTGWDIIIPPPAAPRNLYWVGGTGDWSEVTNWATASGGAGGTTLVDGVDCPPRIQDDVFFDANSFSANDQVVTIDGAIPAECENMTWGVLNTATLSSSTIDPAIIPTLTPLGFTGVDIVGTEDIRMAGDLTLDPSMAEDIAYTGNLIVSDTDGVFDFQSGANNRNMPDCTISGAGASYRQVSDEVEIENIFVMTEYDVAGTPANNHILRTQGTQGLRLITTLKMEDAQLYIAARGNGDAMRQVATVEFNTASHIYLIGNTGNIRINSNGILPSVTSTVDGPNIIVAGNLTIQGNFNCAANMQFFGSVAVIEDTNDPNPTGIMTLTGTNQLIQLGNSTRTLTARVLDANPGGVCETAPTFDGISINVIPANLNVDYSTFEEVTYTGDGGNTIDLTPQMAIDKGGNTNIIINGPGSLDPGIAQDMYWRPRPFEVGVDAAALDPDGDGFIYSGDFSDTRHWALNQSDTIGQMPACGTTAVQPRLEDNVFFDNLSDDPSGAATIFTVSNGFGPPEQVNDMTFVSDGGPFDVVGEIRFNPTIYSSLEVGGNFVMAPTATFGNTGLTRLRFIGSGTYDIDFKDVKSRRQTIEFRNGTFNIQSDLASININQGNLTVTDGATLNMNGNAFSYNRFTANGAATVDIRNSEVEVRPWSVTDDVTLLADNSTVTASSVTAGNGHTYNELKSVGNIVINAGSNSSFNLIEPIGAGTYNSSFSVDKLRIRTNTIHTFNALETTTFLPSGNIEKVGNNEEYVTLTSNDNQSFHNFVKPTGGSIYVCNINAIRINATGVPFRTNAPDGANGGSFYIGGTGVPESGTDANAAALVDNASNTWDFNGMAGIANIDMPTEVHYNVGDIVSVPVVITNNDTGPYTTTYQTITGGTEIVQYDANPDGTGATNDVFEFPVTVTGTIEITDFEYFECPGFFQDGTGIGDIAAINIPSLSGKALAGNGATETYPLNRNLQNYVYVMDGGDRTNLSSFESRLPQLAIQDGLDATETDVLGDITSTVMIDGTEITANAKVYLKRRWELTNTGADADAEVRFLISQAELESLKTVTGQTPLTNEAFLQGLELHKAANGETPATGSNVIQAYISSGIAAEVGATTYFYEANISGFRGTYALSAPADTDGDGIIDLDEVANSTDENNPCDPIQTAGYTGYNVSNAIWQAADCDGDGVSNGNEVTNGTDPYQNVDTDGEGIPEDSEIAGPDGLESTTADNT